MRVNTVELKRKFKDALLDETWAFEKERSFGKWTHGYHRYPAKFLPNVVSKLIENYTNEGDLIADVFAGCGTTLVEAKIHGRRSVGIDINPVSELITKAKINPLKAEVLERDLQKLELKIRKYSSRNPMDQRHDRINHWFALRERKKISYLLNSIKDIDDEKSRVFFSCALSNILKNSSAWLQKSVKPQVDPDKIPSDPFTSFLRHSKFMIKKNNEYYEALRKKKYLGTSCDIRIHDARKTGIRAGTVSSVITSPPYVTSYEYADIHQLTGYWFDYIDNLASFRKTFIGTFYSGSKILTTKTQLGTGIVNDLQKKDLKTAYEIANYFNDMYDSCLEMKRILKKGGKVCLVIGNTSIKDIKIPTAEVFAEIFMKIGFHSLDLIKRPIPVKLIPTVRDKKTGKFTSLKSRKKTLVYPEEFILIAEK